MACGVPTVTYVRDEFMTEELKNSGFIFSSLENLEETLKRCMDDPSFLNSKRKIARESILSLHNNDKLVERLVSIYNKLTEEQAFS